MLRGLARRVAAGDTAAASLFQAQLQRPLARIARGVLRGRCPSSPLAPRIRSEAERLAAETPVSAGKEELAARVARALSAALVERLRAEPACYEAICDTIVE